MFQTGAAGTGAVDETMEASNSNIELAMSRSESYELAEWKKKYDNLDRKSKESVALVKELDNKLKENLQKLVKNKEEIRRSMLGSSSGATTWPILSW
jgi:hypothetical protein